MTNFKPKITIKIFDTLKNSLQELKTIEPDILKMYVCGPTVYDRPHLGNARSIVVYDLFYRFFKEVFKEVIFVRNITDVDDKINASAKEKNISIQNLTSQIIQYFYDDISALNVLRPTFEPKVTENITEIIAIIEKLLANNHAYIADNHVLFDVSSYQNYGELSNRKIDELISGARVEIADYKKTPLDFVLWKPADNDDDLSSVFDSPWGKGRPGWHIECSAMSHKYLGENFDIHGGGADLQFPHHENEIAQSKCAFHGSNYANYWVHNGFLTVNGEKMSKSLKNFITVKDLLDQNINGCVIRLMLLSSHYRKPFDFNEKILKDCQKIFEKFHEIIAKENDDFIEASLNLKPCEMVLNFLADDLNVAETLAYLHDLLKKFKTTNKPQFLAKIISNLNFLAIFDKNYILFKRNNFFLDNSINENYILEQINLRNNYKLQKNYEYADRIRDELKAQNIILEDIAGNKTIFHRNKKT